MARITVEDCLEKIDNQYDLVLLAKERTTQLNSGSPMLVEEDNDKKTIIALREIGDGKLSIKELEKNERIDKNLLRYVTIRVKEFDLNENYFGKEKDEVEEIKKNKVK